MTLQFFRKHFLNIFNNNKVFIFFFCLFIFYYFFNFDYYNSLAANDYNYRYKPNGKIIVENFLNFDFFKINFYNFYLVPELIYGFMQKILINEDIFFLVSDIFNVLILFFSFVLFFKTLDLENKEIIIFIFLIFFFIYIGNWVWCFWKLADVLFLFIFSIIFYFFIQGIKKYKKKYLFYCLFFVIISLFSKPQGVATIPFFLIGIFLLYFKNKLNFFRVIGYLFLFYLITFPLIIFIMKQFNYNIEVVNFMYGGSISGTILYKYDDFLNQFSLNADYITEIIYLYFLFVKKIVYQLTFIRDTYSFKHNIFLIVYTLIYYFFLIINLKYLLNKHNLFFKTTLLISFFSILLHSSLNTADEPNRHQLFNLVPMYVLVSISIFKSLKELNSFIKTKIN
tara:strand:+ start:1037 stop:2221 length:1185 start_codon:yes stop_codon:yes gene_type:complete